MTKKAAGPLPSFCPQHPWEIIAVDFMGLLPRSSRGNKLILTATNLFSKFVLAKTTPVHNAEAVAKFLVFDLFLRYGIPHRILSDQGTPFVFQLPTELYKLFIIR